MSKAIKLLILLVLVLCGSFGVQSACKNKHTIHFTKSQNHSELLFQSGFEDNCSIVKFGANNHRIIGKDKTLKIKNDWDAGINLVANTVHINYTGGDSTKRYAAIIPEPGNPKNKVLQFCINQPWAAETGAYKARVQQELYGIKSGLKEFSQSVRMFLPVDMRVVQQFPKAIKWLTIAEFWNNITWSKSIPNGFRVTLGMGKQHEGESELNFILDAQDCELLSGGKQIYTTCWEAHNEEIKVPIGEWFTLHYYFKEGNADTGRFVLVIDTKSKGKQTVFDITNITHNSKDPNPDGVTEFNPMKMYTSAELANFMQSKGKNLEIYWDDLKIWKGKN